MRSSTNDASLIVDKLIINKIMKQLIHKEVVQKSRDYFQRLMDEAKPKAYPLNLALANNPFIKHKEGYKYLISQLKDYNHRVEKGHVSDSYEMLSYHKIHSMLSDVAQIETRDDQIASLEAMSAWFKDQQKLVQQRYDQGEIRYKMSKQYRDVLNYVPEEHEVVEEEELNIPFYLIERIIEPYRQQSRTLHGDY